MSYLLRPLAVAVPWIFLGAAAAGAQTVTTGTVAISGVTTLNMNRQTISRRDAEGHVQPGEVNFSDVLIGCEVTYYFTPHVGIGALVSHQAFSVESPEGETVVDVSGSYYGPLLAVRLRFDGRSEFVFSGSGGGIRTHGINDASTSTITTSSTFLGRYWLIGGGLSVAVNDHASFDAGVRYQSSTFTSPLGGPPRATSAGLLAGLGFSLYLH